MQLNCLEKKHNLVSVSLSKILKGDRFIYPNDSYSDLSGKIIEVLEVLVENSLFKVSIDGDEQEMPFNITMFDDCMLLR